MIARVIVDIRNGDVDKIFDYIVPDGMDLHAGDRVLVPFGKRDIEGYCIAISDDSQVAASRLKPVKTRLDPFTCVNPDMLALMDFMRRKFYLRYADCLRLFVPPQMRGGKVGELKRLYVELVPGSDERIADIPARAKRRLELVARLKRGGDYLSVLAEEFGAATVNALVDAGIAVKTERAVYRKPYAEMQEGAKRVTPTDDQKRAVESIFATDKTVSLLFGVTGSGKTEVYMEAIERTLAEGKKAIMLVPEISLTPQTLRNFRARFGEKVALMHSGLGVGERYDEWKRALTGEADIVIGARSAVFAPLDNVGLIVLDEEHDGSYVSESNPRYDTAEVAEFRVRQTGGKLVLGSATPSIDSFEAAQEGRYNLIVMDRRISGRGMPPIEIVDMSKELLAGNADIFSRRLMQEMDGALSRGEQVMLFLNRRGHSSFAMCRNCGYVPKCENCDVALSYHSVEKALVCHYCGARYKMITRCPKCGSDNIKMGKIGTQRVVSELQKMHPGTKILRLDAESTTTKDAYLDILGAFKAREAQILVGTQMIAKGHDFPDVTLVGILDADLGLYHSDFRSAERTFQLVTQVAGRAGRADKEGKVLLQTFSPSHYVYRFASHYDYPGFFAKENNTRKVTGFPPYSTIVRVLFSSEIEEKAIACTKSVYLGLKAYAAEHRDDFFVLRAMVAPVAKIERHYRYQIVMRVTKQSEDAVFGCIHKLLDEYRTRGVSVFAQLDPQNMM